jgi:hypothetical protein
MRPFALLPLVIAASLVAQAPAPSLGDRVKAERPAVEKLTAELDAPAAQKRAEALLPTARPTFDKTNLQTILNSGTAFLDAAEAYRLAAEAADSAGAWEKALEYAKAAQSLATECYAAVKEPLTQHVAYHNHVVLRSKQVLEENKDRIAELQAKANRDAGEQQELELVAGEQKAQVESAKWAKYFQTYLDFAKAQNSGFDPLVKVMEDKLKSEAEQVANYTAGDGDRLKWVEAVVSSQAYLEAQGDKAGQARWLYRLLVISPESKRVQHALDVLQGKAAPAPAKPAKKAKKG